MVMLIFPALSRPGLIEEISGTSDIISNESNGKSYVQTIISPEYLDRLCEIRDYEGLIWIAGVLSNSGPFNAVESPNGLPDPVFHLVKRLVWFAQSIRSGAWTYFESTPFEQQRATLSILKQDSDHIDFSSQYAFGMENWRDPPSMKELDDWLDANDDRNNVISWQIVSSQRELILRLTSGGSALT